MESRFDKLRSRCIFPCERYAVHTRINSSGNLHQPSPQPVLIFSLLYFQGQRLSKRTYYEESGLKPSIAYCLCRYAPFASHISSKYPERAAGLTKATTVLDPLCGVATILIEGKREWPNAVFYGGDIDTTQIDRAVMNVKRSGVDPGDLFIWDCARKY